MKKYLLTIKGDARGLTREVNRLHAEIQTIMIDAVNKAIRAGQLLSELKLRVGHGNWRQWAETNLHFSYRTARRYLYIYLHREKLSEVKTIHQAEKILAGAPKADVGEDAVEADYSRIDRDLIAPIRLVRRRLRKVTYQGDNPQTLEMIFEELREQAQGLLADLE